METRKVLSSLCYFSIFFAGFIFPLVVLLASGDSETKQNAKKALLLHIIPIIPVPILITAILLDVDKIETGIPVFTIVSVILFAVTFVVVMIWNIVKGVKVLLAE